MAAPAAGRAPIAPPLLLRRGLVRHPELWVYGLAAVAGLALASGLAAPVHDPAAAHAQHHHHASHHAAAGASLTAEWRGWTVMVLAMMLPVVAPQARRVAMRSLWHRRHRAIAWFLLGYLAIWLATGAVAVGVLAAAGLLHPAPYVIAVALLAAAAWQVSRPRRRVMGRCGAVPPGAARGWRADRDCTRAGMVIGSRCVFTCGPVMLAMAVGHGLLLMCGLLALLLSERARGPNPERRAGRPLEAWWLVAFAAAAGIGV